MPVSDEQLVERIVRGEDTGLFRDLVERYQSYVFTFMYRSIGDRGAAEDLAQETFIALYRSLGSFRGDAKFSTWLYRVAANVLHDELRRRKRRRFPLLWGMKGRSEMPAEEAAERDEGPETSVIRSEERETLASLFVRLPEKYRAILTLYYFNRLTAADIAAVTGLPVKTVETRLARGRQRLKQLWTEEEQRYETPSAYAQQSVGKHG
ncbi:RNA polymerase sigma factor [Paenibacillus alkalitolerans]|uniref:RNA polymerase sigma factor n=1 Tax=Paenibacillus alkalitolerans TaxID=2799335 RepID=UPI0018F77776|nr:sigma-70 family RNA polymerase sigma factor [Paenibacillus alkalitolerans]